MFGSCKHWQSWALTKHGCRVTLHNSAADSHSWHVWADHSEHEVSPSLETKGLCLALTSRPTWTQNGCKMCCLFPRRGPKATFVPSVFSQPLYHRLFLPHWRHLAGWRVCSDMNQDGGAAGNCGTQPHSNLSSEIPSRHQRQLRLCKPLTCCTCHNLRTVLMLRHLLANHRLSYEMVDKMAVELQARWLPSQWPQFKTSFQHL